MITQTIKRAFAAPLVLVFTILFAIPVSAAPPVFFSGVFESNQPAFETSPCPGIVVFDHEVGAYQATAYVDSQGNWQRVTNHITGTDNFYNPENPDVVISGQFVTTYMLNVLTGAESWRGVPYHITAPGFGTVMVRAGLWSGPGFPDGQIAGRNSFLDPNDIQQFCSLLAGH